MTGLRRLLFRDFRIKALALVMALAVYVHVFSGQERETIYTVPIVIAPLPAGLVLANAPPDHARIRVHASGKDLLKLRTRGFRAEVKLDTPGAGSLQRPLLGSDFQLPRGVRPLSVEVLDPRVLHLDLEYAATVELPVAPRITGTIPADRALFHKPIAEPAVIRVDGPGSVIAGLDSVRTKPVSIDGLRGDFEREVQLELLPNLTTQPERVFLRIELEERMERRSPLLAVQVAAISLSRVVAVDPDSATLFVSGAVSVVRPLKLVNAQLITDVSRRGPRLQRVPLRAVISDRPLGAPLIVRCEPESVQVLLRCRLGNPRRPMRLLRGACFFRLDTLLGRC